LVRALVARFCVFYPILLGWGVYLLDFLWDWGTMSRASVVEAELFMRGSSSRLSSFHLAIQPANHTPVGAGQWLYLQCPAVDGTWHPMSLCSASADDILHFHIGVRQPLSDTTQTWTQQVAGRLRDHPLDTTAFRVRGPFGTTFNSVLTPGATATILVGAGSGMTAAESLLRELVQRRVARPTDAHPDVCFIWSVPTIDDVLWCWERLLSLLQETARAAALAVDMTVSGGANLDWFTSTIFVTQASTNDVSVLSRLLQREQHARYASLGAQPHGRSYAVLPASAGSADDAINGCVERYLLSRIVAARLTGDVGGISLRSVVSEAVRRGRQEALARETIPVLRVAACGSPSFTHVVQTVVEEAVERALTIVSMQVASEYHG
jgi:ferredoxin-NADP reductase